MEHIAIITNANTQMIHFLTNDIISEIIPIIYNNE
jgi:hypothetical protein